MNLEAMMQRSLERPEPWTDRALCAQIDPDFMYPYTNPNGSRALKQVKAAKRICRMCPVRRDCLEYALDVNDEWAIMGGTTPVEREVIKARRREAAELVA